MTFWEFIDKQLARINAPAVAGAGIFILTTVVLVMLADNPDLAELDLFKTLSQALVVQGLVGLAMAAWFTKRTEGDPQNVHVVNEPEDPVPTTDSPAPDDPDEVGKD